MFGLLATNGTLILGLLLVWISFWGPSYEAWTRTVFRAGGDCLQYSCCCCWQCIPPVLKQPQLRWEKRASSSDWKYQMTLFNHSVLALAILLWKAVCTLEERPRQISFSKLCRCSGASLFLPVSRLCTHQNQHHEPCAVGHRSRHWFLSVGVAWWYVIIRRVKKSDRSKVALKYCFKRAKIWLAGSIPKD